MNELNNSLSATANSAVASGPAPVSLSVIFPAFNEEANIERNVESARRFLPKLAKTWEIIHVNDVSKVGGSGLSSDVEQCIIKRAKGGTFDAPGGSGSTIQVPVTFVKQ